MRTYKITKRIGEKVGDINKDYDITKDVSHNHNKKELIKKLKSFLKAQKLLKNGKKVKFLKGGYCEEVLDIGIYDGWPMWEKRPAIKYAHPIPGEGMSSGYWYSYWHIDGFKDEKGNRF